MVNGESALKAVVCVVWPVPPWPIATVPVEVRFLEASVNTAFDAVSPGKFTAPVALPILVVPVPVVFKLMGLPVKLKLLLPEVIELAPSPLIVNPPLVAVRFRAPPVKVKPLEAVSNPVLVKAPLLVVVAPELPIFTAFDPAVPRFKAAGVVVPELIVSAPAVVLQVEAAPPVKVKAPPDVKLDAPVGVKFTAPAPDAVS